MHSSSCQKLERCHAALVHHAKHFHVLLPLSRLIPSKCCMKSHPDRSEWPFWFALLAPLQSEKESLSFREEWSVPLRSSHCWGKAQGYYIPRDSHLMTTQASVSPSVVPWRSLPASSSSPPTSQEARLQGTDQGAGTAAAPGGPVGRPFSQVIRPQP